MKDAILREQKEQKDEIQEEMTGKFKNDIKTMIKSALQESTRNETESLEVGTNKLEELTDNIQNLREETDTRLKGILKALKRKVSTLKFDAKNEYNSIQSQFNFLDPHDIPVLAKVMFKMPEVGFPGFSHALWTLNDEAVPS